MDHLSDAVSGHPQIPDPVSNQAESNERSETVQTATLALERLRTACNSFQDISGTISTENFTAYASAAARLLIAARSLEELSIFVSSSERRKFRRGIDNLETTWDDLL